jgi:hypothetical protein
MLSAGKEPLTESFAGWYRFRAILALSAQQLLNRSMATRAEMNPRWILVARPTVSTVAIFLTVMIATRELASTYLRTSEHRLSAPQLLVDLATETLLK